ncbi:NAD-dependent epimerase/dehydratase family protein [Levilactobacillus fujinensis]|uniref:NAD-dependent epimerase/dehydratase family protein n=1 Tax=Levilactobacillus fujinensis TaxID=2486024 RepID=A0ABW1TEF1_9LACO|nr:NAD-dependent epimerase/dehydratase family protein [Levilactobacillus fujinensis]
MQKNDKIVILGITGYTGSWLAKTLTDAGYTNITGTYRNADKLAALTELLPNIHGVQADLLDSPQAVATALTGSQWVFNNSAPFTGHEQSTADFIATKIRAVNNLFKAISKAGTVQKLVQIGSAAAIDMGIADPTVTTINEDTWPDLDHMDTAYEPFINMKVREEQRVRDLANIINLPVTVIHPTNIVGPSFTPWQHDMIYAYLHGSRQLVDGPMDSVDVRDIAGLELAVMNNPQSNGTRVLGLGFTSTYRELETVVQDTLTPDQVTQLFSKLPTLISAQTALALWQPISYTAFYKDQAWRLNPKSVLKTKYPDFYQYRHTTAETTFKQAIHKMLKDFA